jgi:hypothetical protein
VSGTPAEGADAALSGEVSQFVADFIADALSDGWAWSVFGAMSAAGPLDWGIEVSEAAAVRRVERAMRHLRGAAFGSVAGAGTEKVCRRNTSGGVHWWQV